MEIAEEMCFLTSVAFLNHVFAATANAAAAAAAVAGVSAAAASALCNEPAEGAAGGEDAHSAG